MKHTYFYAVFFVVFIACGKKQPLVETDFVNATLQKYSADYNKSSKIVDDEIIFWKERTIGKSPDLVNSVKYASTLISKFYLTGDVNYIKQSDSILWEVSKAYNYKESSIYLSISNHSILQHRFSIADSLFKIADALGLKTYSKLTTAFDIQFELGLYQLAEKSVTQINQPNDYGYQFRTSKLMHYKGNLDSSIAAMKVATDLEKNNEVLLEKAQSNLADLYLHNNDVKNAYKYYKACLTSNASDLHSLMGLGWLALINDKNDSLAKRIFEFASTKTLLPDPFLKLVQYAQAIKNDSLELNFAKQFESIASQNIYGNMYNKYLIQLYTQVLNNPKKAVDLAEKEITNRATPQTYSWLVFALANNNELEKAQKIYEKFVAGKPLEGLELYWMGKFMIANKKTYNAKQYFKEAAKNKYDLSPRIMNDIEKELH